MARPIYDIARDIRNDWGAKVNYGARPYLDAMRDLKDITDFYFQDSAKNIIRYFLSNAATWRGPVAKAIKIELKDLLK